jgi:fumarate reductase subunit C
MTGKSSVNPYVRAVPRTTWYLARGRDRLHMAQELSALFIGIYALLLLCGVRALADGPDAYQVFLASLSNPFMLALLWLSFLVTLFHSVSWFGVTPKAMPVQIGEHFAPPSLIVGGHYVVWIAVSLFILFIGGAFSHGQVQ